jgi:phosphoadenosine phosphosulfate reductase
LSGITQQLEKKDPQERTRWALETFTDRIVLTSSFGAQSAVMLHLATRERPDIPVILVDTGYLFAETYHFIDELTDSLDLNLQVFRSEHSAAWLEARHGKLWENGVEGIERYNQIHKVEPMERAFAELGCCCRYQRYPPPAKQQPSRTASRGDSERPRQNSSGDRLD